MAVRVKIKLNFKRQMLSTVAVANAGFESDCAEVLLPFPAALKLGMEKEIRYAKKEVYKAVGRYVELLKISTHTKVGVVTEDKVTRAIKCQTIISETEDEVVINDKAISLLGIVIEDAGVGLWRFRDDSAEKLRNSEEPERW